MKLTKKILSLVLVMLMFVSTIPMAYAEGNNYKVGDIVQFGSYPQTEVKGADLIAELNALAAILSIAKWKRMMEFYGDTCTAGDLNVVYSVADNAIIHSNHIGNGQ